MRNNTIIPVITFCSFGRDNIVYCVIAQFNSSDIKIGYKCTVSVLSLNNLNFNGKKIIGKFYVYHIFYVLKFFGRSSPTIL